MYYFDLCFIHIDPVRSKDFDQYFGTTNINKKDQTVQDEWGRSYWLRQGSTETDKSDDIVS